MTGRPVPARHRSGDREAARASAWASRRRPCLLVFGGSLGARRLNDAALDAFGAAAPCAVLHACGRRDYDELRARLDELGSPPHYRLFPYIEPFADALAAADLAVARAGGSVFELAAAGLPAILVPYPHATGDHQTANARFMERAGRGGGDPGRRARRPAPGPRGGRAAGRRRSAWPEMANAARGGGAAGRGGADRRRAARARRRSCRVGNPGSKPNDSHTCGPSGAAYGQGAMADPLNAPFAGRVPPLHRDRRGRHERARARGARARARRSPARTRPSRPTAGRSARRDRAGDRPRRRERPGGRRGGGLHGDPRGQPRARGGARAGRRPCCTAATCSASSRA